MKDKYGKSIEVGCVVKTIDFIGTRKVISVDDENDTITTVDDDGRKLISSRGIEKHGFAVVRS
jgi:hypothetical protein